MPWAGLRTTWQELEDPSAEAEAATPPARVTRLRRNIVRRDLLETLVAVPLAPFFGWFSWLAATKQQWLAMAFSVFLTGAMVYIPWRLWSERRKMPKPDPQRPVREYLRAEHAGMRAQAELLEAVWWWYLGPLGVGVVGLYVSIRGLVWQSAAYSAVVLVVYWAIGKGNSIAAKKQYRVAMQEIDEQLAQLGKGESPENGDS